MSSAKQCDICGERINKPQDLVTFRTYSVYKMIFAFNVEQYDVCTKCSEKIRDFIESIKEDSND